MTRQNEFVSTALYENMVTVSFLLFTRSIRLLGEFSAMVVHDPKILSNGRVKIALAQIIETMETCARGLERLPASPVGAETADLRLRQLGKDIFDFVGLLNDITGYHNQLDSQRTAQKFSENTEQIKVNFREAILAYDQAFPGRLEGIL